MLVGAARQPHPGLRRGDPMWSPAIWRNHAKRVCPPPRRRAPRPVPRLPGRPHGVAPTDLGRHAAATRPFLAVGTSAIFAAHMIPESCALSEYDFRTRQDEGGSVATRLRLY